MITTMRLANIRCDRIGRSRNLKSNGHGGLAVKTFFGLAFRTSLLHLPHRDLVSKFQPISHFAATLLLKPSCSGRSLHPLHTSPSNSSRDLTLIDAHERSVIFSNLAFIEAHRSKCTSIGMLLHHPTEQRHCTNLTKTGTGEIVKEIQNHFCTWSSSAASKFASKYRKQSLSTKFNTFRTTCSFCWKAPHNPLYSAVFKLLVVVFNSFPSEFCHFLSL